jgi:hypothetical protein
MTKQTIEIDVPDGYEVKDIMYPNGATLGEPTFFIIKILATKKEIKDFNWYVDQYCENYKSLIKFEFNLLKLDSMAFELKIGLLKFICDDLGFDFWDIGFELSNKSVDYYSPNAKKIHDLCPLEFLQSIFKTNKTIKYRDHHILLNKKH